MWTMHLSLLPEPPSAEPLDYLQDAATLKDSGTGSPVVLTPGKKSHGGGPDDSTDDEDIADNPEGRNDEQDSSSSSSSESEEDNELSRMMREPSDYSSSSDEDSQESKAQPTPSKKRRLHDLYDSPAGNISVLIVSCWTLRLPIMYMDFVRFVGTSQSIPTISVDRSLA